MFDIEESQRDITPFGILGRVRALRIVGVLAAVAAVPGASTAAIQQPLLRIADATPVTIQGRHFHAGERVRVVLRAESTYLRTVRTNESGSFVVRFGAVYAELCTALQLRATGASGAVATLTRKRPPSCAALDPVP